ncbi:TAM41 [Sanghuangporus sanghuang]
MLASATVTVRFSATSARCSRRVQLRLTRSFATEHAPSSSHSSVSSDNLPPPSKPASSRTRTRLHPSPRSPSRAHQNVFPSLPPNFGQNQLLSVPNSTRALLEEIVSQFRAPIRYAFAYGSGVFEQDGYAALKEEGKTPMLDFVFAVRHPNHWHSINMNQFPSHYPLHARVLGSDLVSKVQEIGPGVWFNAFVRVNDVTIKYGVTSVDNLCTDLLTWKTLYLAGRMHKPLRIIKDDARVRLTQQVNLTSALRAALLTLPANFSERELFETITAISYDGDPRMILPAENRSKISNIVKKQSPQFKELYQRLAIGLPGVYWSPSGSTIEQDMSPQTRSAHIKKLPETLRSRLINRFSLRADIPAKEADESAFWLRVAGDGSLEEVLRSEMRNIVRYPAAVQTAKGIVSAGLGKSIRYSAAKSFLSYLHVINSTQITPILTTPRTNGERQASRAIPSFWKLGAPKDSTAIDDSITLTLVTKRTVWTPGTEYGAPGLAGEGINTREVFQVVVRNHLIVHTSSTSVSPAGETVIMSKLFSFFSPAKGKTTPRHAQAPNPRTPVSLPRWEVIREPPSSSSTVRSAPQMRSKRTIDELQDPSAPVTPAKKRAITPAPVASSSRVPLDYTRNIAQTYKTPTSSTRNGSNSRRAAPEPSSYRVAIPESPCAQRTVRTQLTPKAKQAKVIDLTQETDESETEENDASRPSAKALGKRKENPSNQETGCSSESSPHDGGDGAATPARKRRKQTGAPTESTVEKSVGGRKTRLTEAQAATTSNAQPQPTPAGSASAPEALEAKRKKRQKKRNKTKKQKADANAQDAGQQGARRDPLPSPPPELENDGEDETSDETIADDEEDAWLARTALELGLDKDHVQLLRRIRDEPDDKKFLYAIGWRMSREFTEVPRETKRKLTALTQEILLDFRWPLFFKDRMSNICRLLDKIKVRPSRIGLDSSWVSDPLKFYTLKTLALTHFSEARRRIREKVEEAYDEGYTLEEMANSFGKEDARENELEILALLVSVIP